MNERAAKQRPRREALWHVDDGWAVFAGPLHHNAPHAHSTAVYLAGLYGSFRLRIAGGGWQSCRSAVVRAGVPYEFDVGGDPLGVIYLEPDMAGADALAPLVSGGEAIGGVLVGGGDRFTAARILRAASRRDRHARRHAGRRRLRTQARAPHDGRAHRPRRRRTQDGADEELSAAAAAATAGLSASRFQHLFTREVGVPFRRYRGWHRSARRHPRGRRKAASLTAAAHAAGFADQAHFSRAFRPPFGAPPSRGL